jgi:hypothetical protein
MEPKFEIEASIMKKKPFPEGNRSLQRDRAMLRIY